MNKQCFFFLLFSQGQIICPCKVPAQAPTSPQTCPVALWICPPAATAPWVATITPSLLHRACQLRTKWTWPRGSPWETMGPGQTWTCSQTKVKRLICCFPVANVDFLCPITHLSPVLAVNCFALHVLCSFGNYFFFCGVPQAPWCTSSLPPSSITCLLVVQDNITKDSRTQWAWWVRSTKGTMSWGRGQCPLTDPRSKVYLSECVCVVCKLWVSAFLLSNQLPHFSYSCFSQFPLFPPP